MKSILITGCNRGLGFGLVKHLSSKNGEFKHIIATVRNLEKSQELKELAKQNSNIHILQVEVTDIAGIEQLAVLVSQIVGEDGLNVLINNVGIGNRQDNIYNVTYNYLKEYFNVNTIAPIMIIKTFLPLLKQAAEQNLDEKFAISKALVMNMSSSLGSSTLNNDGRTFVYRSTKSALNSVTKSLSCVLREHKITIFSMHPGWVKTDMGGQDASIDVDTSVMGMVNFLFSVSHEHNGRFFNYKGEELPW